MHFLHLLDGKSNPGALENLSSRIYGTKKAPTWLIEHILFRVCVTFPFCSINLLEMHLKGPIISDSCLDKPWYKLVVIVHFPLRSYNLRVYFRWGYSIVGRHLNSFKDAGKWSLTPKNNQIKRNELNCIPFFLPPEVIFIWQGRCISVKRRMYLRASRKSWQSDKTRGPWCFYSHCYADADNDGNKRRPAQL